ncbi:MAG: cytochrome c family protein [Thalassobaculum sp.]|uniref:c-type cytochrome n=1 Tax=Thalassobaculum sp. TaxID=2022740 RepID=UPI0032ECA7D5
MTTLRRHRLGLAILAAATVLAGGPTLAEGDPAAGKKAFRKCGACHTVQAGKNRVGPSLAGIVDRQAGSVEGFKYSKAMLNFGAGGGIWDAATLDAYLADPRGFIKGNKMAFPGMKDAQERTDVIAYLKAADGE